MARLSPCEHGGPARGHGVTAGAGVAGRCCRATGAAGAGTGRDGRRTAGAGVAGRCCRATGAGTTAGRCRRAARAGTGRATGRDGLTARPGSTTAGAACFAADRVGRRTVPDSSTGGATAGRRACRDPASRDGVRFGVATAGASVGAGAVTAAARLDVAARLDDAFGTTDGAELDVASATAGTAAISATMPPTTSLLFGRTICGSPSVDRCRADDASRAVRPLRNSAVTVV